MENHINKELTICFSLFMLILLIVYEGCSYKNLESRIIKINQNSIDTSITFIWHDINGVFQKRQFISYMEEIKMQGNFDSLLIDSLFNSLINQSRHDTIIAFGNPQLLALTSNFMMNRILSGEGFLQDRRTNEIVKKIKFVRFKEIRGESRKEIARLVNNSTGEIMVEKIMGFSHHH